MDDPIKRKVIFAGEPRCELYLGDCLEILPLVGKVDAVVTDPPFGIGFKYNEHQDDTDSYQQFVWPRIELAESLVLPGGPVFVWQSQEWMPRFHELFPRKWRIFVAAKNFVQMRPTVMQHAYEPIVVWWTEGEKQEWGRDVDLVKRDWFIADSARQVLRVSAIEKQHPCPRQLDTCTYIVAVWTRPSGVVLDPFMGSATVGAACAKLGRSYIGIEISLEYFNIAVRRITEAREEVFNRLPFEPVERDEQLNLIEP